MAHPKFNWVNTLLGNVKNTSTGTHHAIRGKNETAGIYLKKHHEVLPISRSYPLLLDQK